MLTTISTAADDVMRTHHIAPHLHGYVYLRAAIIYTAQAPYIRLIDTSLTALYTIIATEYHTSSAAVARSIRYALRAAGHYTAPKAMIYAMSLATASLVTDAAT